MARSYHAGVAVERRWCSSSGLIQVDLPVHENQHPAPMVPAAYGARVSDGGALPFRRGTTVDGTGDGKTLSTAQGACGICGHAVCLRPADRIPLGDCVGAAAG